MTTEFCVLIPSQLIKMKPRIRCPEFLSDNEAARDIIAGDREKRATALVRIGGDESANAIPSVRAMRNFLTAARKSYDVILIKAPPILVNPQSALFGRISDLCFHIVPWKKTARQAVMASVARLKNAGVTVSGVILTGVCPEQYQHYAAEDLHRLSSLGGLQKRSCAGNRFE